MVKIWIDLDEHEEALLQSYADRKGTSVSEVVRDILFGQEKVGLSAEDLSAGRQEFKEKTEVHSTKDREK